MHKTDCLSLLVHVSGCLPSPPEQLQEPFFLLSVIDPTSTESKEILNHMVTIMGGCWLTTSAEPEEIVVLVTMVFWSIVGAVCLVTVASFSGDKCVVCQT